MLTYMACTERAIRWIHATKYVHCTPYFDWQMGPFVLRKWHHSKNHYIVAIFVPYGKKIEPWNWEIVLEMNLLMTYKYTDKTYCKI